MARLYADVLSYVIVLITTALLLGGCVAPSPQVIAPTPQIIMQGDIPGREVVQPIELDNCDGKADAKRTEHRTRSVESTISAEVAAKFGVSAEVLSAEVQATVGATIGWTEGQGTSIELVAPPGTRMAFQLVWIGNEQVGIVQNLRASNIPIAFRSFRPTDVRIKSQYDIGCPPQNAQGPIVTTEVRPVVTARPPSPKPTIPSPSTSTPPTVVTKGELLYQDTFDDPSGWIVEEGMRIENGTMIVSPRYDAVPRNPAIYADFVFESRFYIPATGSMAFYVRHQRPACPGWNCSIQVALYYDNNTGYREVVARRWLGDKPSQQFDIAKNQAASALYPDQWNTIAVLAKGSEYKVYINDASILNFADSTYASGAFVMDNAGPTNEVKIDYIRIYAVR